MASYTSRLRTFGLTLAAGLASVAGAAQADFVINDDLIVDGSACVGFDCVNGESFGFDTIRVKENNTRIQFNDTSSAASFPTNNWQIRANDSANGGASYLGFMDQGSSSTGESGTRVFTVSAGAGAHALFVDSQGDVGFGTSVPAVDLHAVSGNTPTLRLEQNTSSGFAAQTWDLAGNETSFFIRDATNGSTLPFRIFPGGPSSTLVARDGDVGIGTTSPDADLEVSTTESFTFIRLTATGGANPNDSVDVTYTAGAAGTGELRYNIGDGDGEEMALDADGNLTIDGGLITTGGGGACTLADPCDAVFDPEAYDVPSIEAHAAQMWQLRHLPAVGPTGPDAPINMTRHMLRMLNELEHAHIYIEQLHHRIEALEEKVAERG